MISVADDKHQTAGAKSKNLRLWLMTAVFFSALYPAHSFAQSDPAFRPELIDEKALLFQEMPSVYSASKYEQKLSEAPSSVSIVTTSEIKKYGYRTLAEILQSLRGFFTTDDRNYVYLGVRGFGRPGDYNSRILLLVDGHRINDNIYDTASIGTDFPVDVDLIDRVEVIRGPSSSIYGSNAFFAVVNVITKRGRDLKGAEISGEVGSYDSYKGRLSYGNKFRNGLEVMLSGSVDRTRGQDLYFREFDAPSTNNGVASGRDGDRFHSFYPKISYRDFTVEGAYISRDKDIPTAPFDTIFNDPRTSALDERAYFDFKYEHSFDSQLGVMARTFYDSYRYAGKWPYSVGDGYGSNGLSSVLLRDFGRGEWVGEEVQFTKNLFEKHKLLVGGEYRNNFRQDQGAYDEDPYVERFLKKTGSSNWGIFLQDEFHILENLILNAGLRYDEYDQFGGDTNPRLALIYNPFSATSLKFIYGQAFRAPDAYELYYKDDVTQKASAGLKSEKIETYNVVWEQYFNDSIRMITSGYYYNIKDLIGLRTDPSDNMLVFDNINKVNAYGLEIELDGRLPLNIESRISYSIQNAEDRDTGKVLTNSPRHMAKLNIIVPLLPDRIFGAVETRYMSERKTLGGKEASESYITNVTIFSQNILKGLELSAGVYNIFDYSYGDPASEEHREDIIFQDERTFRVKMTYSF